MQPTSEISKGHLAPSAVKNSPKKLVPGAKIAPEFLSITHYSPELTQPLVVEVFGAQTLKLISAARIPKNVLSQCVSVSPVSPVGDTCYRFAGIHVHSSILKLVITGH